MYAVEVHCGSQDMSVGILMTDYNDLKTEFEKSKYITKEKNYSSLVQCSFWEDLVWEKGVLYKKPFGYKPGNNLNNPIMMNGEMHSVLTLTESNGINHCIRMCHATGSIDDYGVFVFEVVNGKWRMRLVNDSEWIFFLKYVNRFISAKILLEAFGMCVKHANSLRRDGKKIGYPVDLKLEDANIDKFISKLSDFFENKINNEVWNNFQMFGLNKRVVLDSLVFWFAWLYMACIAEESKQVKGGPTLVGGFVKLVCGIETLVMFKDWSVIDLCYHYNGKKSMMGEYPMDTYVNSEKNIVFNINNRCQQWGFKRSEEMIEIAAKEAAKAAEDKAKAENVIQSGKVVNMNTNMFVMQV